MTHKPTHTHTHELTCLLGNVVHIEEEEEKNLENQNKVKFWIFAYKINLCESVKEN